MEPVVWRCIVSIQLTREVRLSTRPLIATRPDFFVMWHSVCFGCRCVCARVCVIVPFL